MESKSNGRFKVGLALGGGGVRGLAHIGVLAVLTEAGIPIDYVAGTSVGSMIGAAYCAGFEPPQLKELTNQTSWRNLGWPAWSRQGVISFARMEAWLIDQIGDVDIRDLTTPFAVVTADIETRERVMLREGRLATAVRASCSIPGLVTPVLLNGRLLCDGGIIDNLPDEAVRELGADYVIGVDIFAEAPRRRLGPLGIGIEALETLVRHAGGGDDQVDCLIVPDLAGSTYVRFSKCDELIKAGEAAALRMLPAIQAALKMTG